MKVTSRPAGGLVLRLKPSKKGFIRTSVLLAIVSIGFLGSGLWPGKNAFFQQSDNCSTCFLPASALAAPGTDSVLESALCYSEPVDLDVAGTYHYVVLQDGIAVPNVKLLGDFMQGQNGTLAMPTVLPASGVDDLVLIDGDDEPLAQASMFIGSTSILSQADTNQVDPPREAMLAETRSDGGVTPFGTQIPPAPPIPLEYVTTEADIRPLVDRTTCSTQTYNGQVYAVIPLRSIEEAELSGGLRLLLRKPNGQPIQKGKQCRVREPQDGKPCPDPIRPYCAKPSVTPVGSPTPMSVTVGGSVAGSGLTVTITFYSQPYKRVTKCDIYKCVDGKLVYSHTQKCVNMGSQPWSFTPPVVFGDTGSGVLLGFDPSGWKWQPIPTCTRL